MIPVIINHSRLLLIHIYYGLKTKYSKEKNDIIIEIFKRSRNYHMIMNLSILKLILFVIFHIHILISFEQRIYFFI